MIISYIYINNVKFTPLTVNLHPNCLADSLTWLKKNRKLKNKKEVQRTSPSPGIFPWTREKDALKYSPKVV